MDFHTNSYPSSLASRFRGWWSRPIVTRSNDREPSFTKFAVSVSPFFGGLFTVIAIFLMFSRVIDKAPSHAEISIQHMDVSSATWQIDFLVKDPSSNRYSIYYDDADAAVTLGHLNAAVLDMTRKPDYSRGDHYAAFSLAFVAQQENRSDVVSDELDIDIRLRAKHKRYTDYDEPGHFNIRCQHLTPSREEIIICQSSFTHLQRWFVSHPRDGHSIVLN